MRTPRCLGETLAKGFCQNATRPVSRLDGPHQVLIFGWKVAAVVAFAYIILNQKGKGTTKQQAQR